MENSCHNPCGGVPVTGSSVNKHDSVIPEGARTSDYYRVNNIPDRFEHPDWFHGYGSKPVHPIYRTSNSDYGSKVPNVHTMPTTYRTKSQAFTKDLGKCGMFRNQSLNCGMDRSNVPDH